MSYSGFQLGHPDITLPREPKRSAPCFDSIWLMVQRLSAAVALLVLLPLIALMWILVRASSHGNFLFAQERPGLNGSLFKVYKVRTLRRGSELNTALGVKNNDSRVTAVGKVLRVLKLDELPQLWNIACGEMAFVGPRPIPVALDHELRSKIPGFGKRYQIRPGLTSLGQICVRDNALGDALVTDWKLRFQGELHYINNRCIRYDFLMILMTALYVFKMSARKFKPASTRSVSGR